MSIVCAIAGGSGAGKTTLARKVQERLGGQCDHIAIDWYYRDLAHLTMEQRRAVNYDHPDSLEFELFCDHLDDLRANRPVDAPVYDFATHTRSPGVTHVTAAPVVVTEGILLLAVPEARERYDHSVFIDVPNDVRLERRIARDTVERGRDRDDIVRQWNEFVAPMHEALVQPAAAHADRLVTHDDDLDLVADDLAAFLVQQVQQVPPASARRESAPRSSTP